MKELSFLLVIGQKSQFFFLQEKVKGHAELQGSEGGAWTSESMADRCLQRPDSTSATASWEENFTTATANPSSLHLHREEHVVNTVFYSGKNNGLPCRQLLP